MQKTLITPMSLRDFTRLEIMMSTMTGSRLPLASLLRRKLSSAVVTLAGTVEPRFASEGSWVSFRVNGGLRHTRQLTWRDDGVDDAELTMLQPLGLAVLGLKANEEIVFGGDDGRTTVVVDEVFTGTFCPSDEHEEPLLPLEGKSERGWVWAMWQHVKEGLAEWQRSRAISVLGRLNNGVLADIGLKRTDIVAVASSTLRPSVEGQLEMCAHEALSSVRGEVARSVLARGSTAVVATHAVGCTKECVH